MTIVKDFILAGSNNRPGRKNPMKYITVHNTGNTSKGANAKNHASYVKSVSAMNEPVSWHYTVDENEVYQHIPDNEIAWHAGDGANGTGNNQSIGIEICMNSDGNLLKATDQAVALIAELCEAHNIPVENVVQHNHWSGKNCPQMIREGKPYSWASFIGQIRTLVSNSTQKPVAPTPAASIKVGDTVIANGYPHVSSSGGKEGKRLNNEELPVTKIYAGGIYPIHVGAKGWMKREEVRIKTATPQPSAPKKTIDQLAKEVIRGDWGNGQERKERLKAAGYDYEAVQAAVNKLV